MPTTRHIDTVHGQGGQFRPIQDMRTPELEGELRGIANAGYTMDYMVESGRANARAKALRAEIERREAHPRIRFSLVRAQDHELEFVQDPDGELDRWDVNAEVQSELRGGDIVIVDGKLFRTSEESFGVSGTLQRNTRLRIIPEDEAVWDFAVYSEDLVSKPEARRVPKGKRSMYHSLKTLADVKADVAYYAGIRCTTRFLDGGHHVGWASTPEEVDEIVGSLL